MGCRIKKIFTTITRNYGTCKKDQNDSTPDMLFGCLICDNDCSILTNFCTNDLSFIDSIKE